MSIAQLGVSPHLLPSYSEELPITNPGSLPVDASQCMGSSLSSGPEASSLSSNPSHPKVNPTLRVDPSGYEKKLDPHLLPPFPPERPIASPIQSPSVRSPQYIASPSSSESEASSPSSGSPQPQSCKYFTFFEPGLIEVDMTDPAITELFSKNFVPPQKKAPELLPKAAANRMGQKSVTSRHGLTVCQVLGVAFKALAALVVIVVIVAALAAVCFYLFPVLATMAGFAFAMPQIAVIAKVVLVIMAAVLLVISTPKLIRSTRKLIRNWQIRRAPKIRIVWEEEVHWSNAAKSDSTPIGAQIICKGEVLPRTPDSAASSSDPYDLEDDE